MNYEQIKPYIDKKLIYEVAHPENPDVRIFNYTQYCQSEQAWDEVTKACRGLIMNIKTGEIIARPFPKFFNYAEHLNNGWPIPIEKPIITEKLDGSLGILYWLNGKPYIATRGAFESEQAKWATNFWRKNCNLDQWDKGLTHLFEIIYPENRIVVNYDFSNLVYIGTIDIETGKTVPFSDKFFQATELRSARVIADKDLSELEKMDEPNSEGFVVFYPESNVRMKIKFPEYVRLHKLVTGVSEIAIWEHLREGNNLRDLLDKVPDEFFNWVQTVQNRLKSEWNKLWNEVHFALFMAYGLPTRKDKALLIMKDFKEVSAPTFSLLDGKEKEAMDTVWKMVRPRGNSQFKVDIDS